MHYFVHMYYRETGTEAKFKVRMQVVGVFFFVWFDESDSDTGLVKHTQSLPHAA